MINAQTFQNIHQNQIPMITDGSTDNLQRSVNHFW